MPDIANLILTKFVFLPVVLPEDFQFSFEEYFEEYLLETPFDGKINALHFKIKNPKGVLLYFHGNANNLERWGKIAGEFTKFDYDVLVMDYRGYGKSLGERTEESMYSDSLFFYDFAKEKYGEENLIVYGRSLGGTFAVKVASENRPKMVILESTFFNLKDLINRWLLKKITDKIMHKITFHFTSNESILKIKVPLYHFHGSKDFVVPLKSGKKLFESFKKKRPKIEKKFIEIKGAGHHDLFKFEEFHQELKKIIEG